MVAVVVIGGAGFLGGRLIPRLVDQGDKVRVIDVVSPDGATRLRNRMSFIEYRWQSAVDLIPEDVAGFDVVVFLAAQADVPLGIRSPLFTFQQNVMPVVHYMHLVSTQTNPPPRTIYMSSESVYGVVPRELQPIKEDAPLNPTNAYAVSKLCAEAVVRAYATQYGLPYTILRSTTLYGPNSRTKQVVPIFIRQALAGKPITIEGDGSQSRDFNYVDNMVSGIIHALARPEVKGTFNIGSGREVSIKELAELIVKLADSSSEIQTGPWRPGEQGVQLAVDIGKAKRELSYWPDHSLEHGLVETVRSLMA